MEQKKLRPIGTVFDYEFARPDPTRSSLCGFYRTIITYRVVGYSETVLDEQGTPGPVMEKVEIIKSRKFPQILVLGPVTEIKWHYEDDPNGEWIEEPRE